MPFSLDVIRARKGDCLLLHYGDAGDPHVMLIDGGPSRVYLPHLKPRLGELRKDRKLRDDQPLPIDVVLVSHVDDDHIKGILELTTELREQKQSQEPLDVKVGSLWHNSFDDLLETTPKELQVETQFGAAAISGEIEVNDEELEVAQVLASIPQGRTLRLDAEFLKWTINKQFNKELILASPKPVMLPGGLSLTVAGPMQRELKALQKEHDAWLKKRKSKKAAEAALAAFIDKSIPNLSSIVLLAEADGKSMLLTGDARGDKILEGLELVDRLDRGKSLHVDLLKVPHHGSSNNLETVFFERVTADHYVFSGDGEHGNPERETIEMLLEARGDEPFTLHFTYEIAKIDEARQRDWEKEQTKEKKRGKDVREDWSPKKHSLGALISEHPELEKKIRIVDAGKPHLIDVVAPARRRPSAERKSVATASVDDLPEKEPGLSIPPALVDFILLGSSEDHRQLQDTPILGDVWQAFAKEPASIQDLLVTPHRNATAGTVAQVIAKGVQATRDSNAPDGERADIAHLQGLVAAKLTFTQVLRVLAPLTVWWHDRGVKEKFLDEDVVTRLRLRIRKLMTSFGKKDGPEPGSRSTDDDNAKDDRRDDDHVSSLERFIALAALILWAAGRPKESVEPGPDQAKRIVEKFLEKPNPIVDKLLGLLSQIRQDWTSGWAAKFFKDREHTAAIFHVSLNRRAVMAISRSVPAVKADAARTLFSVNCSRIVWGILDSGIDATHPAFQDSKGAPRVRKTFDFRRIREIVSRDALDEAAEGRRLSAITEFTSLQGKPDEARALLQKIRAEAEEERPLNWGLIQKFVCLENPPTPRNIHGTHVAGILGAKEVEDNSGGMCPDIQLYDFRVLAKSEADTEFAIIAALQYIRYINELHNHITIHGVNLSLSIPHNVRNYACGRTPICDECERMVESGVVVVTAAGNRGFQEFVTQNGSFENYAAFSITDPGNADSVITVGSTHRHWPHTYGVSFYSSRGPTGDGRLKPDLVAPGERIYAPTRGNEWGLESGTSMAAPHVSGAAAMLLARYAELIGQPRRVKRILCESATDLGRERSFQGSGMLDVLRAFQSI